jgi:hypothetical protein
MTFTAGQVVTAAALNAEIGSGIWTPLTLENSWVRYSTGFPDAAVTKTGALAVMRGLVKDGTTTISTRITTVPVGFRPSYGTVHKATSSNDAWAVIRVEPDGSVRINGNVNAGWLSLDICWVADS